MPRRAHLITPHKGNKRHDLHSGKHSLEIVRGKREREREMRGRRGAGQLPELQVDLGRRLQKRGNSLKCLNLSLRCVPMSRLRAEDARQLRIKGPLVYFPFFYQILNCRHFCQWLIAEGLAGLKGDSFEICIGFSSCLKPSQQQHHWRMPVTAQWPGVVTCASSSSTRPHRHHVAQQPPQTAHRIQPGA